MALSDDLPWISIVTVVRNGASYLEETIQSVLAQSYPRIDFIVVDGKSTDGTLEIVRRYEDRLRWISEPDKGIYDAMNKGIEMARGDWINFLNGGDTFIDKDTVTSLFAGRMLSTIFFLYGDSINVYNGKTKYIGAKQISKDSLKKYLGLCHQSVFVKKEFCLKYDLTYHFKAEYNWVIEIVNKITQQNILYVKMPVVYYALGGFSERGLLQNLREFILLTYRRYGFAQVILNGPFYSLVLLRAIKYKTIGH